MKIGIVVLQENKIEDNHQVEVNVVLTIEKHLEIINILIQYSINKKVHLEFLLVK
jgi:hypothetical protein